MASAYVAPYRNNGGKSVRATVNFANRKKVVVWKFTVRDICRGDNAPVKAQVLWVHMDGTTR